VNALASSDTNIYVSSDVFLWFKHYTSLFNATNVIVIYFSQKKNIYLFRTNYWNFVLHSPFDGWLTTEHFMFEKQIVDPINYLKRPEYVGNSPVFIY